RDEGRALVRRGLAHARERVDDEAPVGRLLPGDARELTPERHHRVAPGRAPERLAQDRDEPIALPILLEDRREGADRRGRSGGGAAGALEQIGRARAALGLRAEALVLGREKKPGRVDEEPGALAAVLGEIGERPRRQDLRLDVSERCAEARRARRRGGRSRRELERLAVVAEREARVRVARGVEDERERE